MDHIDGNSDNNTEENLRLICPNCHALTPSHKGRNRGRGRTRQRVKNQRYADGLKY
jgi:predicted HNH restriction endonuclease